MSPRRTFDRYQALRYGIVRRLLHARITEEAAERWVVAWEEEAHHRGLDAATAEWWRPAWQWISEQRSKAP
jgi:hypothetical protein